MINYLRVVVWIFSAIDWKRQEVWVVDWVFAVKKDNAGSQEASIDDLGYQEKRDKVSG